MIDNTSSSSSSKAPPEGGARETRYPLRDRSGKVVAVHVRKEKPGGKEVRWKLPSGEWGLNGTKIADLPLYGIHELHPDVMLTVVTEGEKARDGLEKALREAGYPREQVGAVGTCTGASGTPSPEALEDLRGLEVVLWTDADDRGREHMERVAERLDGVAAKVRVFDWPEAKEKDDAADHPAVISGDEDALARLMNDLVGAREWGAPEPEKSEGLPGRVLLGELLRGGIEPTPQLLDGLLYEGRIHSIASGPGTGKTLLAEWMAIQIMKQGLSILYIDAENGPKLIAERLQELGADLGRLDELFHYFPAEVALDRESLARLMATVEQADPALVVFDSFADLLSIAGLEENSNDDCTRWMRTVAQPIKDAGSAVLVLDHVPKGGKGPRGGGSKRAKVDVQWNLEVTQPFDRERTGEIELKHDKDREAWLPRIVRFSVGGGVFARSAGTIEEPGPDSEKPLNPTAQKALDLLRSRGGEGADWKDLQAAVGNPASTHRAVKELDRRKYCRKENGRYYDARVKVVSPIESPDGATFTDFHNASMEVHGSDESAGLSPLPPPPRGGSVKAIVKASEEDDFDRKALEALRRGSGPRKALEHHKTNGVPFEQVILAVMIYLGRRHDPVDDWEASVIRAVGVLGRGDDVEELGERI